MILDGLLTFTGTLGGTPTAGSPASPGTVTDSPTTGTQVSSQVLDLGISGLPNSAGGGGARDIGIGDDPAIKLSAIVTTAFTGGTSLQLTIQGAPDNGSGAPGAYTTLWTSTAYAEAALIAGAQLANIYMPQNLWETVLPRFLRLQYITVGTHGAGALEANLVLDRDEQITGTTGAYSGYPAGVVVAN